MSFRLDHHNKILTILKSFNQDLLRESFAYFGGGIDLLAEDLGLVATERTFKEQHDLFGY